MKPYPLELVRARVPLPAYFAHVGFTGTRRGLTHAQRYGLRSALSELAGRHPFAVTLHHGDCEGADVSAHFAAARLGYGGVVIHTPEENRFRAYLGGALSCRNPREFRIVVKPPAPYLDRDRAIVRAAEVLVACPAGATEVRRSGTWATVRYAVASRRPVFVVPPDGRLYVVTVKTDNDTTEGRENAREE